MANKKEKDVNTFFNTLLDSKQFKNTILIVLLLVFFGGYIIFFTSPYYMPENTSELKVTELNTANQLDSTHNFTILRWQYSEEQKRMEVEIDVDNTSFDGIKSYNYLVRTDPSSNVRVTPIIENNSLLILQLDNISRKFNLISLQIMIPGNENSILKLYTNKEVVEHVDTLEPKTEQEYNKDRLKRNIKTYNDNISQLRTEIHETENKIFNIEQQNKELIDSRQFKTESEIKEVDNRINTNNQAIIEEKNHIKDLEKSILEYQNRITLTEEQLKELK